MNSSTPSRPKIDAPTLSVWTLTTPVAMGYIPLGMVFGFLFVQAGATAWMAILVSILVYAGAAQYMMIPMMAAGLPTSTIALATLIINLRHMFYGLSLLHKFPQARLPRWYMVFALTDETYSVLTTLPAGTPVRQLVSVAALNHAWWVLGTAVGAVIGAQAQLPLSGLDFVLAALFAVLTVEQWRIKTSSLPLWTALVSYAVAYAVAPAHALVIAIVLCIATGIYCQPKAAAARKDG